MMREVQSIPRSRAIVGQRILLSLCATAVIAIAVALWMTMNLFGYSGARWLSYRSVIGRRHMKLGSSMTVSPRFGLESIPFFRWNGRAFIRDFATHRGVFFSRHRGRTLAG
jgi:hypothetical protein